MTTRNKEASRGFEPRSLDSESRVLTVTPRGHVMNWHFLLSATICIWIRKLGLEFESWVCSSKLGFAHLWFGCLSERTLPQFRCMLHLEKCSGWASKASRSRKRRHLQYNASRQIHKWTHWGLNPGPPACWAGVIPLHHVPNERMLFNQCLNKNKSIQHFKMFFYKQCGWVIAERKKWSHAGLNRGPYGYWPYALANWAMRPCELI